MEWDQSDRLQPNNDSDRNCRPGSTTWTVPSTGKVGAGPLSAPSGLIITYASMKHYSSIRRLGLIFNNSFKFAPSSPTTKPSSSVFWGKFIGKSIFKVKVLAFRRLC